MCGILGSINCNFGEDELSLISRRGPDDWGISCYDVCGQQITLGHRRLSIVDLSPNGHQPMSSDCGKYHIIFNGEIYNHEELRSQLRQTSFHGHSDTETILAALREQGIDAVRSFNGIFGFAFLAEPEGKLYLARDPFGVKPVYYVKQRNQILFSSEIKPLLRKVSPGLDAENLALLLQLRYLPSPETLFQNIKKIRPGCYITINLRTLEMEESPFFAPLPATRFVHDLDPVQEYGRIFDEAIRRQLMADVDIGILLSGGVDSALVAQRAAKFSGKKIQAFTVGFQGNNEEDEIADAAETAATLGLEHFVVKIDDQQFFQRIAEMVSIVEEPLATTSALPMMALSELAASNVKVVLTGQGADEPLGGYGRYQGELLRRTLPVRAASPFFSLLQRLPIKNQTVARGLKTLGIGDDIPRFLKAYEVFSPEEIREMVGVSHPHPEREFQRMYQLLDCRSKMEPVERMMALDTRMDLADDLLIYTDKITMHYSLECRVPLLDLDLVRFIESLPLEYRLQFRKTKIIHKQFAQSVLPKGIINRRKRGFQSPTRKWFQNEGLLREIFFESGSPFSDFFARGPIEKIIRRHRSGANLERHIFLLLSIKFWMDSFLKV